MTIDETTTMMRQLALHGMADAFMHQSDGVAFSELPFADRVGNLIHAERAARQAGRIKRILKQARLRVAADPANIDFRTGRNLDRSRVADLLTGRWIDNREDLVISGATGTGKTWLACALATQAARQLRTVRYYEASQLFEDLQIARADGTIIRLRNSLSKYALLVIDDFGLTALRDDSKEELQKLVTTRSGNGSMLFCGQLPVSAWHDYIDMPMIADTIIDRVRNNAHRIQLEGESMRNRRIS